MFVCQSIKEFFKLHSSVWKSIVLVSAPTFATVISMSQEDDACNLYDRFRSHNLHHRHVQEKVEDDCDQEQDFLLEYLKKKRVVSQPGRQQSELHDVISQMGLIVCPDPACDDDGDFYNTAEAVTSAIEAPSSLSSIAAAAIHRYPFSSTCSKRAFWHGLWHLACTSLTHLYSSCSAPSTRFGKRQAQRQLFLRERVFSYVFCHPTKVLAAGFTAAYIFWYLAGQQQQQRGGSDDSLPNFPPPTTWWGGGGDYPETSSHEFTNRLSASPVSYGNSKILQDQLRQSAIIIDDSAVLANHIRRYVQPLLLLYHHKHSATKAATTPTIKSTINILVVGSTVEQFVKSMRVATGVFSKQQLRQTRFNVRYVGDAIANRCVPAAMAHTLRSRADLCKIRQSEVAHRVDRLLVTISDGSSTWPTNVHVRIVDSLWDIQVGTACTAAVANKEGTATSGAREVGEARRFSTCLTATGEEKGSSSIGSGGWSAANPVQIFFSAISFRQKQPKLSTTTAGVGISVVASRMDCANHPSTPDTLLYYTVARNGLHGEILTHGDGGSEDGVHGGHRAELQHESEGYDIVVVLAGHCNELPINIVHRTKRMLALIASQLIRRYHPYHSSTLPSPSWRAPPMLIPEISITGQSRGSQDEAALLSHIQSTAGNIATYGFSDPAALDARSQIKVSMVPADACAGMSGSTVFNWDDVYAVSSACTAWSVENSHVRCQDDEQSPTLRGGSWPWSQWPRMWTIIHSWRKIALFSSNSYQDEGGDYHTDDNVDNGHAKKNAGGAYCSGDQNYRRFCDTVALITSGTSSPSTAVFTVEALGDGLPTELRRL